MILVDHIELKGECFMVRIDNIKELYKDLQDISLEEVPELIEQADTEEEQDFIRKVITIVLGQKQKQVILEKRF